VPFIVSSSTSEKLDVEMRLPGDKYSVIAGLNLRLDGWRGGIWVQYVTSTEGDYVVELSDGNRAAGFLLFPSEDYDLSPPYGPGPGSPQNWISSQPREGVGGQNVVAMICGGPQIACRVYETRRIVAGARTGVPIVYALHDALKVSENGLLCNDSDADLATVGIANPIVVGIVSAVPSARNDNRLGADIKY
jgi:hypothetical protein